MGKGREFFYNSIIMTATALLMRAISVVFNIYIAGKIGFAGIGLIELIMSVYGFAMIVACSGVSLAATRLVAEEISKNSFSGIRDAMRKCIIYSIVFGLSSCVLLLLLAELIGIYLLKDARTVKSLYILSFSLPLISVQSAFFGYFTAVRRVIKSAVSQITDQLVRICLTVIVLKMFLEKGLETACIGVSVANTLTEVFSFFLLLIFYVKDIRRYKNTEYTKKDMSKRLLRISLPVAFSTYAGTALSSLKHILIPIGLVSYGLTKDASLAAFGMIGGMVLPIITFPSAFLYAGSSLIVPEITECYTLGNKKRIDYIASQALKLTLMFSIGVVSVFLKFPTEFGMTVYKNMEIGIYIRILAPIILITYLDSVVDAMLKGLDKQVISMFFNIFDSCFSIILVLVIIPRFGIKGMLFVMFAGKLFNMLLSLNMVIKVTDFTFRFKDWIVKPALAAFLSVSFVKIAIDVLRIGYNSSGLILSLYIIISLMVYYFVLRILKCITSEDIKLFRRIISRK